MFAESNTLTLGPSVRGFGVKIKPLQVAAVLVALSVIFPLLLLVLSWYQVDTELWAHLFTTQLGRLLSNTVFLLFGVAVWVSILGVSCAWFTSMCDFPGRRFFEWGLMLPMAIPAYVMGFVFLGLLDFSGPVQTVLREWGMSWLLPSIKSGTGVVFVMGLVLYPYVYMLARSAFLQQGMRLWEASRSLGQSGVKTFFRVSLPLAWPAVMAGVSLACMESLADFGTVAIFNYDTFTTAIYKSWYGFFSLTTAAQLASILLLFVFSALWLERKSRGNRKYYQTRGHGSKNNRLQLSLPGKLLAFAFCGLVFALAFIIPMFQLVSWAVIEVAETLDHRYWKFMLNSVLLGTISAFVLLFFSLILAFSARLYSQPWLQHMVRIGNLGYAIPGSVLAVGIMLTFNYLDSWLVSLLEPMGLQSKQLLVGGVITLILAYSVRFMAVAFGPVESSLARIRPSISEAARTLGANQIRLVFRIYLPILMPGMLTAMLLVLVDVMKEMPATLLLRPFGWDTLAVKIYEFTSEGEWEKAAIPGLALVFVGFLPVLFLVRRSAKA